MRMPIEVGTIIIPWMANLKMSDKYFIIPLIYALVTLAPNLLPYISYLKIISKSRMTKSNLIFISIFSIVLTVKAPVAIGLYFITTNLFSLFEEIGYRLYMKNQCVN
jgi:membrane protein insertase Oxa1/YidC/SpoIIIJ